MNKFLISGLLIAGLSITSCKKEETKIDPIPIPPSTPKIELLAGITEKAWIYDSSSSGGFIDRYKGCDADNNILYRRDGNFFYDRGDIKCDTSEVQRGDAIRYVLNPEGTNITETTIFGPMNTSVLTLTATHLALYYPTFQKYYWLHSK